MNFALQGGGAHGAFGWGVLDALLEDGRLKIESLSGTSAGVMNAVAVADGLVRDGAVGARSSLRRFWEELSRQNPMEAEANEFVDTFFPGLKLFAGLQELSDTLSPYETNPLDLNPLIDMLETLFDFEELRRTRSPKVFVATTNVFTGKGRIFHRHELDAKIVMASACLPNLFRAVEIRKSAYWDGGYTANPALWPLMRETAARDIVLIRLVPLQTDELPRTLQEIMARMHQITFNNSLLQELRAIDFVNRLVEEKRLDPEHYSVRHIHRIDGTKYIGKLPAGSAYDINPSFLAELRDAGRATAKAWLKAHYDDIGQRSTHDVEEDLER